MFDTKLRRQLKAILKVMRYVEGGTHKLLNVLPKET